MANRKARITGFDSLSIGSTEIIPDKDGIASIPEETLQDPDFLRWVEETNKTKDYSFQILDDVQDAPTDKKGGKKAQADAPAKTDVQDAPA